MTPPAPLRLSTTTCLPRRPVSCVATMRPTVSLMAPGGNGTISRTGFDGYSCAVAPAVSASRKLKAVSISDRIRAMCDSFGNADRGCHPGRRAKASRSGTQVSRCCGFDSARLPSALGYYGSRLSRFALGRDDNGEMIERVALQPGQLISREIVALLDDEFEQERSARLRDGDGFADARNDVGRRLDAACRDVEALGDLGRRGPQR